MAEISPGHEKKDRSKLLNSRSYMYNIDIDIVWKQVSTSKSKTTDAVRNKGRLQPPKTA